MTADSLLCTAAVMDAGEEVLDGGLLQELLETDPVGDIQDHTEQSGTAVVRDDLASGVIDPEIAPILSPEPVLHLILLSSGKTVRHGVFHPGEVIRMDETGDLHPGVGHQLLIGISQHVQHIVVDEIEGEAGSQVISDDPAGQEAACARAGRVLREAGAADVVRNLSELPGLLGL